MSVFQSQHGLHPHQVLMGAQSATIDLPVCDHYSGVEARIRKSLQLQAEFIQEFGTCVFDATLDCEDGAATGGEFDHAQMVAEILLQTHAADLKSSDSNFASVIRRMGVRVHPLGHPAFETDLEAIVAKVGHLLSYVMLPKIETLSELVRAIHKVDAALHALSQPKSHYLPIHVLLESALAVHHAFEIARHARVESISFGLMDFVSSHGGAIPGSAMDVSSSGAISGKCDALDQFSHPLVLKAKLEVVSACHAFGKVPSHCVVTEFSDPAAIRAAALRAARELGYTRMWSIHPSQIRPILEAMAPAESDIEHSAAILEAAHEAQWAPVSYKGRLHDRASYRYDWLVVQRAFRTGRALPQSMLQFFNQPSGQSCPQGVPS
jgi:citrate lyase subunit beta/citryl-CoA lyase